MKVKASHSCRLERDTMQRRLGIKEEKEKKNLRTQQGELLHVITEITMKKLFTI